MFALKEVKIAEANLKQATKKLEAFQEKHGKLNVETEQAATSSFISVLESRLVDLKVEEAALRRQYRDPDAPEVSFRSRSAAGTMGFSRLCSSGFACRWSSR